jgi:hypothetical protein
MFRGGAERLVLIMAKGLGADICTGFWSDSETFPKSDVPHELFVLGSSSQKSGWRYLKFQWLFYFQIMIWLFFLVIIVFPPRTMSGRASKKYSTAIRRFVTPMISKIIISEIKSGGKELFFGVSSLLAVWYTDGVLIKWIQLLPILGTSKRELENI